jgi:hypothetical protein
MSHPTVSVDIAIKPASVTLGAPCSITLSTTLSHPTPITIYTWPSAFHLNLSQQRRNFFCIDLSNNDEPVMLELTKGGRRSGHISLMLNSVHDQYLRTLVPGETVEFTAPFFLATRSDRPLIPGHRYRFGFNERESIQYWMEGTREEVMSPPGVNAPFDKGSQKIMLDLGTPIEFDVVESETQMQCQTPTAEKARGQPLLNIEPSMKPWTTDPVHSPAMILTWISFITSGLMVFYVWTDACFTGIPETVAAVLPGPLPILAIFWLHMVPVALVARRDGKNLRAMVSSQETR